MVGVRHPFTITIYAEERRADFLAQAERDHLARLSQSRADRRDVWPDLALVVAIVVLALLLAAGAAIAATQAVIAAGR